MAYMIRLEKKGPSEESVTPSEESVTEDYSAMAEIHLLMRIL